MKKAITFTALAGIIFGIGAPLISSAATAPTLQKLTATCVSGSPQITITWTNTGAQSYSVMRLEKPQTQWLTRYSRVRSVTQTDKYVKNATTYEYQIKTNPSSSSITSNTASITTPNCSQKTTPVAPPQTPPAAPATTTDGSGTSFQAYITGYGWPDNTPASAEISNPVLHKEASGTGTYADPITIAVGHSITGGKDILDYPEGTKFYIPALKRYFIVEDTCGDGNAPQNGPCHTGFQGNPWLDVWVGGSAAQASATFACESKITGVHTVIKDPSPNYAVVPGAIFSGTCSSLYSETPATI